MISADESVELAQQHAARRYPPGYSARLEAEIRDPPGFFFGPERVGTSSDDATIVGAGGFFVSSATGEVRHFGSGQLVLASAAAWKDAGTRDLAVSVEYLLRYSADELHRRAGHQKLPRNKGWTST